MADVLDKSALYDNPLKGWQVDRTAIRTIGRDLQRPECLLAERDGTLWAADARGGVMRIAPDGLQRLVTPYVERPTSDAAAFEDRYVQAQGSLPNGLAFAENGDFLIANWGTDAVEIMTRDGRVRTLYTEIDGQPLTLLDDSNPTTKARLFEHFKASMLTPEILGMTHGTISPWMASLTFGGPDLHTVYVGSLRGTTIPYFRSPVAGQPMIHWHHL